MLWHESNKSISTYSQPSRGGGKGAMGPGRHYEGGGIWGVENMEFWNLAASSELAFALQTVIFLYPLKAPKLA